MKYVNANVILPKHLIEEIQKYIEGETLYIPKKRGNFQKWGTTNGTKNRLNERNSQIRISFMNGVPIENLAEDYHLSAETIKKIVYSAKN